MSSKSKYVGFLYLYQNVHEEGSDLYRVGCTWVRAYYGNFPRALRGHSVALLYQLGAQVAPSYVHAMETRVYAAFDAQHEKVAERGDGWYRGDGSDMHCTIFRCLEGTPQPTEGASGPVWVESMQEPVV